VNVRVRYLDRDGTSHDEIRRGLTAGTFQHECDHLDGVLYPMRMHDMRSLGFTDVLFPGVEDRDD
jgi:peptide deformylase